MAVTLSLGRLRQVATLSAPGPTVPDGDGGFTQTVVALSPESWNCAIQKASVSAAERHFSATVLAHATHILNGRFHSGITTETIVSWTDSAGSVHTANVLDVDDTEGAGVESVVLVSEIVDTTPAADTSWVQVGWVA